ncbi:hypothetical protein [Flavobacterium terrigena]|uniref:YhhN-like protein n=1 Tax=Flavobacterium terrigena TaxID=402734 RepID=A0A1H6V326_9FLAO|nr:hypothetical protein [Flavobacterium terrigena]SEI95030.1 hypothetical protein SAMN05660918_2023 [Flavobacterium terrigena]
MKNNIQSLLKRDLEVIPLMAYFIFYFLYLVFDRILEQEDYAILVKPIIIPIIAFLYLTNKKSKRTVLNIALLVLIFVSDNSTLLEIRSFYVYATIIYMLSVYILFYYALLDMKYFQRKRQFSNKVGFVLASIFIISLLYLFFNYNIVDKAAEKFVAFEYMIIFMLLFLLSMFNFIQLKSKKTKYLFLMILCLFLSHLCFSMHKYYNGHVIFKYLICLVETPVYYFLLKYLLRKDKEIIEQ